MTLIAMLDQDGTNLSLEKFTLRKGGWFTGVSDAWPRQQQPRQ